MSLTVLDACHLLCPLPVIKTQNKIQSLSCGDILEVHCTDPGTLHDIPAWCRVHGHHILDTQQSENLIVIRIKVE